MEKVQWNSINKKQNGLKQSKNEKSCTLLWDLCYDTDLYCNNNNKPWLSPPPMRGSKNCRVKLIVTYVPGLSTLSRSLHSHSSVAQVHLHTIHPAGWCEGGLVQQRNDGGCCVSMRERWKRVESPRAYVTEWVSGDHFCYPSLVEGSLIIL